MEEPKKLVSSLEQRLRKFGPQLSILQNLAAEKNEERNCILKMRKWRFRSFPTVPSEQNSLKVEVQFLVLHFHFPNFIFSIKTIQFLEHIWQSKKLTLEVKPHEDILECSYQDHQIQQKILLILEKKISSIRQFLQVLQQFYSYRINVKKFFLTIVQKNFKWL